MIWLEILSRQRQATTRLRFDRDDIRIGRGYDNDVVLDDPYVASRHVRILRDESGQLVAEDLGSINGIFLQRDKRPQRRIMLDGNEPIRVGHTYLRVREDTYAVPPERVARPTARAVPVAIAIFLIASVIGLLALETWFDETTEPRASHYLQPLVGIAIVLVVWVGVWALLTRVLSGSARFQRNLLIALYGALIVVLYRLFAQFASFAVDLGAAAAYQYAVIWTIVAVMCFFHLREIGRSRLVLKGVLVTLFFGSIIALQTLQQLDVLNNSGRQAIVWRLMPPGSRLAPLRKESAFFAEVEQLRSGLDRDRGLAASTDGKQ